ncbi:MAG: ECF-type sigma factor [Pseudomonadota bacterium]
MGGERPALPGDVTRLLMLYAEGDRESLNEVLPIVYGELKSLAKAQLGRSGVRQHMHTTVLVHEAYEKLAGGQAQNFTSRRHFFAIASRAMRQIVVDTYRRQMSAKRGGGLAVEELGTNHLADLADPERLLNLDQAMDALAEENGALVEIIDLACFAGLSTREIAELRGEELRTVQRQMQRAKAWIGHLLDAGE